MLFAALLISRQPLRPSAHTPWVTRTRDAVMWLREKRYGLISSVGLQTWEMATVVALELEVPLRLIMPSMSDDDFQRRCVDVAADFELRPPLPEFVPGHEWSGSNPDDAAGTRDALVTAAADLLLPISCRPGGRMVALLERAAKDGKEIDRRFETREQPATAPIKYALDPATLNPALSDAGDEYLIHWTRANNGRWPGESKRRFYSDVMSSGFWPHSGLFTLRRIIEMKKIIASPRHMPGNVATVSFTGLTPAEAVPLMRWRARYHQMSFEPYGLGIRRSLARELGIKPVEYFEARVADCSSESERWLSQSIGSITDWRAEQEYRHRGDFDLSSVPREDLAFFCHRPEEGGQMMVDYGLTGWSFLP